MAAACYTQALKLFSPDEKDKEELKEQGVILKNRAACYLKLVSIGFLLLQLVIKTNDIFHSRVPYIVSELMLSLVITFIFIHCTL